MTDKELSGRNRLKEAMKLSDQTYLDKYLPIENEVKYSEKYLKYIDRLTKQTKLPFYKYFNTIGKRVAGIAAAMLIAFSCAMTVKAIREPVVEFFANIYEKFVEVFFGEDDIAKAPDTIETVYTLGFIPDGYEVDRFIIDDSATSMLWRNAQGDMIVLSQGVLDGSFTVDVEESDYDIINWNGKRIAYTEKYGIKSFFWNSIEYEFSLTISDNISDTEAFALIESLKKYNQ